MIEHNFTEANKRSCSGLYVARLFRLPDADDGSIRMSLEVRKYQGGYVIFHLPDKYWLGTNEQLDWDAQQDILFWTCNGQARAFIFDVTHVTFIGADAELNDKDRLDWDAEQKCWIKYSYLYSHEMSKENDEDAAPIRQKPGDYFEKTVLLKLPYSDSTETKYKLMPTYSDRFILVLKQAKKMHSVEPTMWKMGIIDIKTYTWVVQSISYHVGLNTVRVGNKRMQCYGYDLSHKACYIFSFDLDTILKNKKVELFIHDFDPLHPERVTWDGESNIWRAVINGEVIIPRPFYFDNMYTESLPIDGSPVPAEILELLPKKNAIKRLVAEENQRRKKQLREEYEKNNTSLDQLSRRSLMQSFNKKHLEWGIAILALILMALVFVLLIYYGK